MTGQFCGTWSVYSSFICTFCIYLYSCRCAARNCDKSRINKQSKKYLLPCWRPQRSITKLIIAILFSHVRSMYILHDSKATSSLKKMHSWCYFRLHIEILKESKDKKIDLAEAEDGLLRRTCCTLFSSLRLPDDCCLAEESGDSLSSLTLLKIPVYFSPDSALASSHSPNGGTATSSSAWIKKCKSNSSLSPDRYIPIPDNMKETKGY